MKKLIESLREQYRMHGSNHVQRAADVIENLIAELAEGTETMMNQAKTIEGLMQETEQLADGVIHCEKRVRELTADRDAALAASRWETDLCQQAMDEINVLREDRDAYQRAADKMAAEHKIERDAWAADAERYQWLVEKMQDSYDSDQHDQHVMPGDFSIYCSMVSAWRTERTVEAEIVWTDTRDERLGLSAAIDAARGKT